MDRLKDNDMSLPRLPMLSAVPIALALAACSKMEPTPAPAASTVTTTAPAQAAAKSQGRACDMVGEAEMSAILGGAVLAKPNDRSSGQTQCIYTAAAGISPYAELKVEWGEGRIAMSAMGTANKAEPGLSHPLEGLGDQAAQIGPALMIRSGEDLVTIVFSGVDDGLPKARKIYALVKTKL